MEYSEEVQKLAETLKSSGLAASMSDALERAQRMVGGKDEEKEEVNGIKDTQKSKISGTTKDGSKNPAGIKEEPVEKKIDMEQTTLGEVKETKEKAVEESTEGDGELKKEEVFTNEPEQKKENPSNQKKVDYSKERKIDLTDVFNVNKS